MLQAFINKISIPSVARSESVHCARMAHKHHATPNLSDQYRLRHIAARFPDPATDLAVNDAYEFVNPDSESPS